MSKSYDNTIPLFAPRAQLEKLIYAIKTDSRAPGEAKDTQDSALFQLYQAFATPDEVAAMRKAFADGIAWGDAKKQLFERIDREVAPMRERYDALMANPAHIEALLRDGAQRLRARYATPLLQQLREAVGLRDLSSSPVASKEAKAAKRAAPTFKQYRENDGRFYFKLVDGDRVLLQSEGFDSARDAGQLVARAKQDAGATVRLDDGVVRFGDGVFGRVPPEGSFDDLLAALATFAPEDAGAGA